jgi:predicted phosphodiesterase
MKIGIITDIHISHYPEKKDEFKKFLEDLRVDMLIIAGDIVSSEQSDMELCLKMIRENDPFLKVLLVRGNHCFWNPDRPFDSVFELDLFHKELFKKYDIHYLQQNKFEDENLIIYGFDGWYRFSETGTNDITMMPTTSGMGELTPFQYLQREERDAVDYIVKDLEENPSKKTKIVVTHFNVICEDLAYEKMSGNPRYVDILCPDIDYLFFGHTHQEYSATHHGCEVINVGADYDKAPKHNQYYKELVLDKSTKK